MREILMSLSPYWYYLIGEGIKRIEVRSRIPKDQNWNKKVECYMAKNKKSFNRIPKEFQEKYKTHFGKVGMQFVCDWITKITPNCDIDNIVNSYTHGYPAILGEDDSLSFKELKAYLGNKIGYDLHISDLKIYDEPKELEDFIKPCPFYKNANCLQCEFYSEYSGECRNCVTRPPQSWCYVEEL